MTSLGFHLFIHRMRWLKLEGFLKRASQTTCIRSFTVLFQCRRPALPLRGPSGSLELGWQNRVFTSSQAFLGAHRVVGTIGQDGPSGSLCPYNYGAD